MIAVDTETTGLGYWDEAFGASVYDGQEARWFELPDERESLRQTLLAHEAWVFHNAKFDMEKLLNAGIITREELDGILIHDTECLAHMLDADRSKALKSLARVLLGIETDEDEVLKKTRKKYGLTKADGYDKLPREIVIPYALKDVEYTWDLFELLWPRVEIIEDLRSLYWNEQHLQMVLLDMERRGMAVDVEYLDRTCREYKKNILMTELSIRDLTTEEFNPNSPIQVTEALDARGHTVPDTKKPTLASLKDALADMILRFRSDTKIHGTYLVNILAEQRDGIFHPWFRQHGTRSGRMSSGGAEA